VIARFVLVLSRQSGVAIFGNRPREVLSMQESLKQKESITRYTAPDFYKKTRVFYEVPGNLLQVNRMDYKFEVQKYFKGTCDWPKRVSARTVCNEKIHTAYPSINICPFGRSNQRLTSTVNKRSADKIVVENSKGHWPHGWENITDRQCKCNVILRSVHVTIAAVGEQWVLRILRVCL
jgi:hypothetical protein